MMSKNAALTALGFACAFFLFGMWLFYFQAQEEHEGKRTRGTSVLQEQKKSDRTWFPFISKKQKAEQEKGSGSIDIPVETGEEQMIPGGGASPSEPFFLDLSEQPSEPKQKVAITVGGTPVMVELAETFPEQVKGLSGRTDLAGDEGMLFVFDSAAERSFWMRGMRISIDIIWISKDGTVVDIHENLAPETYPKKFSPREEVQYVLEVPAGFVARHTLQIGARVDLSNL